ncbi:hypothetical protein D0Z07_4340 [Hyphodiscus hymeniophilus]|uniref:Uncharacterized protein n=1 Tax=Hyphodiscus hymeniophilus TaxID=353542 RepID=A0A9P6VKI1_9HELO|nr:hypothetical protein D0Z07_4340 [Hyphodiscus hymeniophilus]
MMAQGASTSMATKGAALTAAQLREILEYEKIVQFRDAVLAGTHPRIKIPPHLSSKQVNNPTRTFSSSNQSTPSRASAPKSTNRSASGTNHELSSPYHNSLSPNNQRTISNVYGSISSTSQINPILLEKSDDLIKAEIQLQRQRLERALREQIEQQRLAAKLQTSEGVPNFDVAQVLLKALAIVLPSTTAGAAPSVGTRSSASDSFDENTFYSSQHDTPIPSSSSQGHQEPLEVQTGGAVGQPAEIYSTHSQVGKQDVIITGAPLSTNNHLPASHSHITHLQQGSPNASAHYEQARDMENSDSGNSLRETGEKVSAQDKRPSTVSILQNNHPSMSQIMGSWLDFCESGVDDSGQTTSDELLRQAFENDSESQLIRAHNLSPYAPQPARVSPLATARNPPVPREPVPANEAPPAQVAALRKSGVSSADSSPKGVKTSKKKDKKKKRKASSKDDGPTPDSPYIKPEPRSPSPYEVAPLPRPQKRQRQSGQYGGELNYDDPRYDEVVQGRVIERGTDRYKEPRAYERYEERYEVEPRRPEPVYQRIEREDVEYRRIDNGDYVRRPQSPAAYALPYAPSEARSVRAASHAFVDRRPREEPVYYREPLPRASVRPDADRERSRSPIMRERRSPIPMGPPRQPIRILVDAYGREYIDPPLQSSIRQSMAPPSRYRDAEVVYERAPVRTISGRPHVDYEEDGVVYRRPASPTVVPRRVVTQPEYALPEHRAYRQREYSVRPMAPPGDDYIQLRGGPERRQMSHFDDGTRELIPRPASVRPAPVESIRYEVPREYVSRVQSVRPEGAPRELAAQSQREYSVRPVEGPRREHVGARDAERYYDEVPSRRPTADVPFERPRAREQSVAFIERPRMRDESVVVYENDVRREVRDVYR